MIAVKRLQSLFWVLLVALGALGAYLVSLRVATERNELMHVRTQIAAARADIRYLETEFSARASMRQLERWNAEDFRYSALTAEHYLDGERALAHLDGVQPNGPAYVGQPVLVAMVESGSAEPAPVQEAVASPAVLQIRSDPATIRAASFDDHRVKLSATASPAQTAAPISGRNAPSIARADKVADKSRQSGSLARKTEQMAMLDARLLDDRTLGDIGRRAAAEIKGGGR